MQGYPSKSRYYRAPISSYKYAFDIPAQPVSAQMAAKIFRFMGSSKGSKPLPPGFQGTMNVSYALLSGEGVELTLNVANELMDKDTFVVCGSLYGEAEPDRSETFS